MSRDFVQDGKLLAATVSFETEQRSLVVETASTLVASFNTALLDDSVSDTLYVHWYGHRGPQTSEETSLRPG